MNNYSKKTIVMLLCLLLAIPALPQMLVSHPWQGKRVAYLGDSITDPRNKGSKKKYWGFLQDWLQITPYVYGVSGRQWNDIPRQVKQCYEEHGDEVDAIIIFIGTNDYNAAVPLGVWYDECEDSVMAGIHEPKHMVKRQHRTPQYNDKTYRGRINIALKQVKETYPHKQVVVLTPIHRGGFYANDRNWQPSEDWQNGCGEYVTAYIEASKEAAAVWAVPVIDWSAVSGLMPILDVQSDYFKSADNDRLHPNDEGHTRLARTLMYQLLTLPCTF
ncbi:MAG: SGNH/GDSL hydrolase family protein [Prevotella sp.]|nr:SGNH/GDSL hydrolase family protein [Prevotella sp.]